MFRTIRIERLLKSLVFLGLLILIVIIFSQQIELTSVDLGRHLANGREVFQHKDLLFKNFYSFTEPDFKFVNHHWLAGLIFYVIYLIGGFKLLSILNILLILAAFILAFNLAKKKAGFYLTAFLAIPVILLLSQRVEIRPEIFSYLFLMLTWTILEKANSRNNYRLLWYLLPLFLIWVNIHIYFFIGLALIGFKVAADFLWPFISEKGNFKSRFLAGWKTAKPWFLNFIFIAIICLLNPNTIRGLLYPFNIFRNYGYEVAENKSIFYLSHMMQNPNFGLFKFLLFILILSWVAYFVFEKKWRLFDILITVFFSLLALFASRNLSIFSLIALVIISANLIYPFNFLKENLSFLKADKLTKYWFMPSTILLLIILISNVYLVVDSHRQNNFIKSSLGWGLYAGSEDSAQFFKENDLTGPIFNNYDLGSALIFWLSPQEKVFVDNRPEAYSIPFFADIYRPMQTDPQKWQEYSEKYQIKTIYFSYIDFTPWAVSFLPRILKDPDWALVYFDRYTIILLNKKLVDQETIDRLAIDNQTFRTKIRELAVDSDIRQKFHLATLAGANDQSELAEEIYRQILFKYPEHGQTLTLLGSLYASNTNNRQLLLRSLGYFDQAIQAGHQTAGVYNQKALVFWQLEEYEKAEASWRSALKLDRTNNDANYYLDQVKQLRWGGRLPLK